MLGSSHDDFQGFSTRTPEESSTIWDAKVEENDILKTQVFNSFSYPSEQEEKRASKDLQGKLDLRKIDNSASTSNSTICEENLAKRSLCFSDKRNVELRYSSCGSSVSPFIRVPWQLDMDWSCNIHSDIRENISIVMNKDASLKEIFSPFTNSSFHYLPKYLKENDYFLESLNEIASIDRAQFLGNKCILSFITNFVEDFVKDFGSICLKHQLLHMASAPSPQEVTELFANDNSGQIENDIKILIQQCETHVQDDFTNKKIQKVSSFDFCYNSTRETLARVNKNYRLYEARSLPVLYRSVLQQYLGEVLEPEKLLDIFFFACHHYTVFKMDIQQLLLKRTYLIPQLICEKNSKITIFQTLLSKPLDIAYQCLAATERFEEGRFSTHWFSPFSFHVSLERLYCEQKIKRSTNYDCGKYNLSVKQYLVDDVLKSFSHLTEVIYWQDCTYKYHDPVRKEEDCSFTLEILDPTQEGMQKKDHDEIFEEYIFNEDEWNNAEDYKFAHTEVQDFNFANSEAVDFDNGSKKSGDLEMSMISSVLEDEEYNVYGDCGQMEDYNDEVYNTEFSCTKESDSLVAMKTSYIMHYNSHCLEDVVDLKSMRKNELNMELDEMVFS